MKKTIDIYGTALRNGSRYTMLPTGLYCNEGLRKAERGDRVRLHDGWKTDEYVLGGVLKLDSDTPEFDFFFRSIFRGWNITRRELWQKWEAQMLMEGKGRNVVAKGEALVVELLPVQT